MMGKTWKRIFPIGFAVLLCLGGMSGSGKWETSAIADGDGYYALVTAAEGDELLGQIHDLITTTHTHYATYGECRDYAHITDYAPGGEKSVMEFYTHETILYYINDLSTSGGQGTWNREHVWPQSLSGGLWGTNGAGADMHHIRPSEVKMNSQRGNDKFGEVNGGEVYSKTMDGKNSRLGGHHAGGVFEPLENVKGDVARIVMYVYTHYNTFSNVYGTTDGGNESYFGTLHFTDVVSAKNENEAIALLLRWHRTDPVAESEIERNEAVFEIQGNRNPFIDHPEYAEAIWGNGLYAMEFHDAVAEIVQEGALEKRFESLKRAIAAYQALTEEERTLAEEDVTRLRAAIEEYNRLIEGYQKEAQSAQDAALGGIWNRSEGA